MDYVCGHNFSVIGSQRLIFGQWKFLTHTFQKNAFIETKNKNQKNLLTPNRQYVQGKHSLPMYFQDYVSSPPYVYDNAPVSNDRSMGAIWYKHKQIKEHTSPKSEKHRRRRYTSQPQHTGAALTKSETLTFGPGSVKTVFFTNRGTL